MLLFSLLRKINKSEHSISVNLTLSDHHFSFGFVSQILHTFPQHFSPPSKVKGLMLLRNRSRAVTKPSLMGDHSSQPCPNQSYKRTIPSSIYQELRIFKVPHRFLPPKPHYPHLIIKLCDIATNPKLLTGTSPRVHSENKTMWDSKCIGLALVGALKDKPNSGTVLFRTKLRVKQDSSCSGTDFVAKTKDSPLSGVMSLSEMELSEEYTCVIAHGPNPRTTHIYDNCIVESYCSLPNTTHSPSLHFLSFCHTCKKHLEQTKDIFIYRGEKAFCSQECRHQEMVLDEAETN